MHKPEGLLLTFNLFIRSAAFDTSPMYDAPNLPPLLFLNEDHLSKNTLLTISCVTFDILLPKFFLCIGFACPALQPPPASPLHSYSPA